MASTPEDQPKTIVILNNDYDPEDDPLTVEGCTNGANGAVVVNANGTITYTPESNFVWNDTFVCTICEATATHLCDDATVSVNVGPNTNDQPVVEDDLAETPEDESVNIPILNNDNDPDGDLLTTESCTNGTNGVTVVNADGTVTYTPNANYAGQDTFECTICDDGGLCDVSQITVTVHPVNDPPVAVDDKESTPEDQAVDIYVLVNDSDPDPQDVLTITSSTNGSNGVTVVNANFITYIPNANYNGVDTFEYTISDGEWYW